MYSLFAKSFVGIALIASVFSAPTPSADGFPTPNAAQLQTIEQLAQGTLPNGAAPAPGTISAQGITNFQLINFNENFEVAFFQSLLYNVTNNLPGYQLPDLRERDFIIKTLSAVIAQEELHAILAGKVLSSQGQKPILPCQYMFPTTTFGDAIALAQTFTDVVMGTLQDVVDIFAVQGLHQFSRSVAAVIGQEGEQNGFYRILQEKIPSALPFLTTSIRDFAFTALQGFVVPGSCPNQNLINLKIYGNLNLLTKTIEPKDQNLQFSFDVKSLANAKLNNTSIYTSTYDWTKASLVYINQQNTPVVEAAQNVKVDGTIVTFEAAFPYSASLLNGLTIAAVTSSNGPFANAQAVADAAIFAPAFIEVN